MNLQSIFEVNRDSVGTGFALLLLRVSFGLSLFLKHGLEKITGFNRMAQTFPDPFHLGTRLSLSIATASDVLAAVCIIVGFATRLSASFIFFNIAVAWIFVHKGQFFGEGADHGEICILYMAGMLAVCTSGPGRLSVDALIAGRS